MRPRWWQQHGDAIKGALLSGAFYLAFALIYTFPLVLHLDSGILRGLDTEDAFEQTWVLAWVQHSLLTHPSGLFNAPIFYPTSGTLAYQDNLIPLAVAMLPVSGLVHNPLVVYNLALLLAFPLSGLAMYALALHLSGDRRAAFLAGIIFAFSPYRERHIEHLNQLSAEGIPLMILGFELARTRGGAWRWGGFGLAVALCATLSLYYTGFACLGLTCYALLLLFKRRTLIARTAWRGIWALGGTLPLLGALVLPYLHTQQTVGSERRLHDIVYFSADVRDFLHAGPQSVLYGWSDSLWNIPALDVRQYLFPGWTALVLAILGAWLGARTRRGAGTRTRQEWGAGRLYIAMAAVMALLTMGPYLRLFGLFTKIPLPYFIAYLLAPGISGLRDIGRCNQVTMAFLAGAAAIGAARLLAMVGPRRAGRLLLALTALLLAEYWVVQRPLYPVASGSAVPPVYRWLAHQPAGVVAELPMCRLPGAYCLEESTYMYYSTYHWHPLANGGGGFFPQGWDAETAAADQFPAPSALAALEGVGVRYVVVHPNYPGIAAARALVGPHAGYIRIGAVRVESYRLGNDLVFVLPSPTHTGADNG